MNSPYVYTLSTVMAPGVVLLPFAVFDWPNGCRKYIRDTYTLDGELHLPPKGRIVLFRARKNPKAPNESPFTELDIEAFLAQA